MLGFLPIQGKTPMAKSSQLVLLCCMHYFGDLELNLQYLQSVPVFLNIWNPNSIVIVEISFLNLLSGFLLAGWSLVTALISDIF